MNATPHLSPDFIALAQIRQAAASRLAQTELPSIQEEPWRKIRLPHRLGDRGGLNPFSTQDALSDIEIQPPSPAPGLRVLSFEQALKEPHLKKKLEAHLKNSLSEADDYFALQNLAQWKCAVVFEFNTSMDSPLYLKHFVKKGHAAVHRVLFSIADNVEVTLIEEFGDAEVQKPALPQAVYWNTVSTALLGQNSHLRYLSLRKYSHDDHHFQRFFAEQGRDSRVFYGLAHCGGALGKGFLRTRLLGANAEFRGAGIYAGSGKDFHDMEMLAEHYGEHSQSALLYKAVVREQAHSVFDGQLVIASGVKAANSHQSNQNILLDPEARAEAMPRLVIRAEDVSCEHGATVGMLDEEALFYLQSRGLSEKEARYLMVEGFLNKVIQDFPLNEEKRLHLLQVFKHKLAL